ncbi:hypothetical protein KXW98_006801 [Aspergillus fumigatus]|uniref:INO80 complex subunit F domain-containing protein n=1 Tax=Aspergillus fumigatus TaxID=746128 RepID=A0A229YDM5_ASPFM|nr:hypothetical protein CNMCM8714_001633 [Aspergillus fumigatus]KMK61811.1 hypothetical protein Y699_02652 [Aspergillus fumigatus Z5]KAF4260214.1 hypothetical protein CNMCM8057_002368 [Aspergillus fumigatus]KAF4267743.1 hypothetical protein CNMCM8812_002102 [Aspergillus fumigatus]KAF4287189.1 hypothetical protein CNMCM8689_000680 [Aspergillus fumigatus]
MDTSTKPSSSLPSSNPPSVEGAYKRKCIALKKRLNEIEAENEMMRMRNKRGWQYIQKMRLESCILLERLAKVTGMAEEAQAGVNPELRARAAAMMSNAGVLNGFPGAVGAGVVAGGGTNGAAYVEDETEGSSDEQPPTPQERPLRVKRSRKSNIGDVGLDDEPSTSAPPEGSTVGSAGLPRLAPAPTQEDMTSTFRIRTGSNGAIHEGETSHATSERGSQAPESGAADRAKELSTTPMDVDQAPKEESQG